MSKISFNEFTANYRAPRFPLPVNKAGFPLPTGEDIVTIDFLEIVKGMSDIFDEFGISNAYASRMEAVEHYIKTQRVAWNLRSNKTGQDWTTWRDEQDDYIVHIRIKSDNKAEEVAQLLARLAELGIENITTAA